MSGKLVITGKCCIWAVIAIMLSFMAACTESSGTEKKVSVQMPRQILSDSLLNTLQQGDLVLRRGRDVASYMISQAGVEDKTYSHCGLVQIENGIPMVYHFINGIDKARCGLVRDAADVFFSIEQNNIVAVKRYAINEQQKKRQSILIKAYYKQRRTFDMDFDMADAGKLYCSEFVYHVMNEVMRDSSFIKPATQNGFAYIPIDVLYMNGKAKNIWQMHFK
jgi:hypothetical protein